MKKQFSKGQKFGNWTLESYLGGGGNGDVWKCLDDKGNEGAIKLLRSVNPKSYARFLDETTVLDRNKDIIGLIPVIDAYLPDNVQGKVPFFVMSIAENAEVKLKGRPIEEKIDAILQVCETLEKLHKRGISHRDLKPANLLFYNSRLCISDFGLVDYPDKKEISSTNEVIGAKWTMAPEMRRESSKADGIKADMYSLAKTMWIVLTENYKGFDGQYSPQSIIELRRFYPSIYTTPIDKLLTSCTDNDPEVRSSIGEFIYSLKQWKLLNEDFHERNLEQWFEIQSKLFPAAFPKRVIWEDINDIVTILKIICSYENLNHMFFPKSGGMDLENAKLSAEAGCIELDFQLIDIVKPKRLLFESFGYSPEWNYFRLELDELAPSGVNVKEDEDDENLSDGFDGGDRYDYARDYEEVTELQPGQYDRYELATYKYEYRDMGYDIPDTARNVTRWFRGAFVIFNKRSPYNLSPSTYDGRHNRMNTDEFRNYIQRNVDLFREEEQKRGLFSKLTKG